MISSKSSPPPSTYDEPGKPFDALLKATGCSADSTAVSCLKAVPSEVDFLHFVSTCILKSLTDIDEHKQYIHQVDSQSSAMATDNCSGQLRSCSRLSQDSFGGLCSCTHDCWYQCQYISESRRCILNLNPDENVR